LLFTTRSIKKATRFECFKKRNVTLVQIIPTNFYETVLDTTSIATSRRGTCWGPKYYFNKTISFLKRFFACFALNLNSMILSKSESVMSNKRIAKVYTSYSDTDFTRYSSNLSSRSTKEPGPVVAGSIVTGSANTWNSVFLLPLEIKNTTSAFQTDRSPEILTVFCGIFRQEKRIDWMSTFHLETFLKLRGFLRTRKSLGWKRGILMRWSSEVEI
jgi:hypothetical protein